MGAFHELESKVPTATCTIWLGTAQAPLRRKAGAIRIGIKSAIGHHRNAQAEAVQLGNEIVSAGFEFGAPSAEYVKGSGGIFRYMMIHDFDMARFLMGEEFVVVSALGAALVDKAIGASR